jgi:hypothetical protein
MPSQHMQKFHFTLAICSFETDPMPLNLSVCREKFSGERARRTPKRLSFW